MYRSRCSPGYHQRANVRRAPCAVRRGCVLVCLCWTLDSATCICDLASLVAAKPFGSSKWRSSKGAICSTDPSSQPRLHLSTMHMPRLVTSLFLAGCSPSYTSGLRLGALASAAAGRGTSTAIGVRTNLFSAAACCTQQ